MTAPRSIHDDILAAFEAQTSLNQTVLRAIDAVTEQIDRLWDDNAELRGQVESLGRVLASRTDHLA